MNELDAITENLRNKGYRSSSIRRNVLKILSQTNRPLFTSEIITLLNQINLNPNKSTVYRETDKLLIEGVLREVDLLDGKKRYELNSKQCHHHFVCNVCQGIECIDLNSEIHEFIQVMEKEKGFEVQEHMLELFGICRSCKSK